MKQRVKTNYSWLLKKLGIWNFVWHHFCEQYPVRISAKSPEAQSFMKEHSEALCDMMIYGMGAVKHVPFREINQDGK